jgi:hypothetical protein
MKKYLCLLALLLPGHAGAGVVSISVTESTQFENLPTIDLASSDDFALWGATPSDTPLVAQYSGTGTLINRNMADLTTGNPVRTLGQFDWHEPLYQVSESTATRAGVQHYPLPSSPLWEGFRMQVFPHATENTVYSVYGTSWGGTTRIMAFGAEYEPVTVFTGQDVRFKADFNVAAGGGPLLLQFQLASMIGGDRASDANVTISAISANTIQPVPEPSSWLLALLGVIGLYKPVKKYRRYFPRLIDAKPREQDSK